MKRTNKEPVRKAKRPMTPARLMIMLLSICTGLFAVTFAVYILNLDMKLTSLMEPFMLRHYDRIERDQHL